MASRLPTYFVSHGGGPWPFMKAEYGSTFDRLEASLAGIARETSPKAVLVVTSHWEAPVFALSSGERPGMIYDYGGFPPHTYHVSYPAPGDPDLARRAAALLQAAGIDSALDPGRGFDHGTFSMLYPMYPKADMPVVQLSIKQGYDPLAHVAAGRALAPLRDEGVLIIGSGLSFHNLRLFGPAGGEASHQFDAWLNHAMALPPAQRLESLLDWDKAPAARIAHPREDHLVPLMAVLGAAENEPASAIYHEDRFFGGLAVTSFRFGDPG